MSSTIKTDSFTLATYAQGDPAAPKLALVLPGLLETKDYLHMVSHVDFLAQQGFYAISFDMPGTWHSAGDITRYTTTNCLKAIAELIATFNRPTFLIGHSNGGRLAALAAVRNPQVFAFVSIMCAPTFVRDTNRYDRTVTWKNNGIQTSQHDIPGQPGATRQFDLPFAFCEDAQKYDARQGLGELKIPKLFIAGEHDTTVLPQDVKELFAAAAGPKQFVQIDSDHNCRRHPELITQVNGIVGDFLHSL